MATIQLKENRQGVFTKSIGAKVINSVVYVIMFGVYLVWGMVSASKKQWTTYKENNPPK